MANGRYMAKWNGKGSIGHDTPRQAIDAVVNQLSLAEVAARLYLMYGVKVVAA